MESVAVFGCPPFPQDMGLVMEGPHFLQDFLPDAKVFCQGIGIDQLSQPEFRLSHFSADIILDGIHLILGLVLGPVSVAADAGVFEHVPCTSLAVESKGLSFFVLDLGHMTVFAFYSGSFVS